MAPPVADTNVIRRSIYQNSNTLVELLIKSKEPRGRPGGGGSGGGGGGSEPAWPAAVPVRRDGRPLSATSRMLPPRPRTGRPLPAWKPAGSADPSPERRPVGRGGGIQQQTQTQTQRQPPGPPQQRRPSGQQQSAPPARTNGPAAPPPAGSETAETGDTWREFGVWTGQLKQLVQDIRKRPATAHLRPLLCRLEETVRAPPEPPAALRAAPGGGATDEHEPLRARLEEIQRENEDLQRKFQSLGAAMREYQQQRMAGGDGASSGGPGSSEQPRRSEAETELGEVKRQLAKYKKYAKELKKTKENLLNTIQSLEETHATEMKSLKEEHNTQMAQVLAQFTSETDMLVSFKTDAEAVQRSLAQRVRENSELQHALAERDIEVERLATLNQTLHDLALKQLQQLAGSELPSLSQLMTKLQSPGAGGAVARSGGAGDFASAGAGDSASAPPPSSGPSARRDVSLFSLDVTEPLPARPFPHDWTDLSLISLTGSVDGGGGGSGEQRQAGGGGGSGGEQRPPADGARPAEQRAERRATSGAVGDPTPSQPPGPPQQSQQQQQVPASARSGGSGGGGGDSATRPTSGDSGGGGGGDVRPPQPRRSEAAAMDTNRRLFGDGGSADAPVPDRSGRGDQLPDASGGWSTVAAPADPCVQPSGSGSGGGGDEGDCRRPLPVGSMASEECFQQSLARLNEKLSDLQQGIHRAALVLTP